MADVSPLAALHARLGIRRAAGLTDRADPGDGADGSDPLAPLAADPLAGGWIPDGRPGGPRAWLMRTDPGRAGAIALAGVAVVAVLLTVFTLMRSHPAPVTSANLPPVQPVTGPASQATSPTVTTTTPAAATQAVVVSVVGLVQQPGLVTVAPHARVADAVAAAGGPITGADTLGLNLARHVDDGEQIVVGIAAPAGHPAALGSSVGANRPGPAAPASATPAGPLDLNTATAEQLDTLPGVGPVTAAAIVAWRQANGRFTSVEQLAEVDGIGQARLDRLRALLRV